MSTPTSSPTSFADALAALQTKVESLHLEQRVDELTVATERAIKRAVEQAGALAHDKRGQVVSLLDRAEAAVEDRTEGRYAAQVTKVRAQLLAGVDKLAAQRPGAAETATGQSATDRPADPASAPAAGPSPQDAPRDDTAA